jgi:hypothetical protein
MIEPQQRHSDLEVELAILIVQMRDGLNHMAHLLTTAEARLIARQKQRERRCSLWIDGRQCGKPALPPEDSPSSSCAKHEAELRSQCDIPQISDDGDVFDFRPRTIPLPITSKPGWDGRARGSGDDLPSDSEPKL